MYHEFGVRLLVGCRTGALEHHLNSSASGSTVVTAVVVLKTVYLPAHGTSRWRNQIRLVLLIVQKTVLDSRAFLRKRLESIRSSGIWVHYWPYFPVELLWSWVANSELLVFCQQQDLSVSAFSTSFAAELPISYCKLSWRDSSVYSLFIVAECLSWEGH